MQAQQPTDNKWSFLKILAIVGDITSVTGISLLYLREGMNFEIDAELILRTVIAVSIGLGVATFFVTYGWRYYHVHVQQLHFAFRFAYFTVVLPVAAILLLFFTRACIEVFGTMAVTAIRQERLVKPPPSPTPNP